MSNLLKKTTKKSLLANLLLFLTILTITGGLSVSVGLSNLKGDFIRPPFFNLFRAILCIGQGLLATSLLCGIIFLSKKFTIFEKLNVVALPLLFGWYGIYVIWAIIRGFWGIDLSFEEIYLLLRDPFELSAIGIGRIPFYCILLGLIVFIILFTLLTKFIISQVSGKSSYIAFIVTFSTFVIVNLLTRLWITYHVNRNQYAVMALDAYIPFQLKTEYIFPGIRQPQMEIENLEIKERNERYLNFIKTATFVRGDIPNKYNILWIVIDSLRFDSINGLVTPNIWRYRERFQVRLNSNHWSGGNATQFGIFSMLTGISAYHMYNFFKNGIKFPFINLLIQNGYHVRIGKREFFNFRKLYNFLPENVSMPSIDEEYPWEGDKKMTELFLKELSSYQNRPRFDFLTMDATHWPYYHPPESRLFIPSYIIKGGVWLARSKEEIKTIFNSYKNALYFIDIQVGKILDYFSATGRFNNTIIIITGDHGEEFQERGQLTHTGVLNDYQARVPLWIHFPVQSLPTIKNRCKTIHIDIIPTLLDFMGFKHDILYTQGRSILRTFKERPLIILAEQGNYYPLYHSFVTDSYISRWWHKKKVFVFSGVQKRDGSSIRPSENWFEEIKRYYREATSLYQNLPDISKPPTPFLSN